MDLPIDLHVLSGVITAMLIGIYLGIFRWAYSRRRQADFEQAARLPFAEQDGDEGER